MRRFSLLAGLVLWLNMDGSSSLREPAGCQTPALLADGDIKYSMKVQYSHNERVEYACQSLFTMEGGPFRTCLDGEWTGHIRCLKPCTVTADDMRQRNIILKYKWKSGQQKVFVAHNGRIEFVCMRGRPDNRNMIQYCRDGVLDLPTCS